MTHAGHVLHAIDVHRRQAVVVHYTRHDIRISSFLDGRALRPGMGGWHASLDEVEAALGGVDRPEPRWLFHLGHVGSTAVSRCLDLCPGVLGLREPLPLLALAHERAHRDAARWLAVVRAAVSRTFPGDHAVVVKPTSVVTVLAPILLASPRARGVLLWSRLDLWLASLLRDAGLAEQVLGTASVRGLDAPLPSAPVTALAMLWLHEQSRWQALAATPAFAGRMVDLEFDLRDGDPVQVARRAGAHFALDVPDDFETQTVASGTTAHDAKQPGLVFDAARRRDALLASHKAHASAIGAAIDAVRARIDALPDGGHLAARLQAD